MTAHHKSNRKRMPSQVEANLVRRFEERFGLDASQATISLYRKELGMSNRATLRFLGNFDSEDLDEADIQRQFGGGTYVLKLLDSRGRWRRQCTVPIADLKALPER